MDDRFLVKTAWKEKGFIELTDSSDSINVTESSYIITLFSLVYLRPVTKVFKDKYKLFYFSLYSVL